ncbi:hypothetical protein B9G79_02000 [Bdellovibrio bacteriovorus]|uniref:Uncharacterized protein n=1 Tax=Bdellovibrio bacteriovorus TaxID=959 RepID=A0A1Z3N4L8_BDEBC|nr:hypothetical protein B9G79_02000 [Bdellovibrio bacteriovorus]
MPTYKEKSAIFFYLIILLVPIVILFDYSLDQCIASGLGTWETTCGPEAKTHVLYSFIIFPAFAALSWIAHKRSGKNNNETDQ